MLPDLVKITGLSIFEILMQCLGLLGFSIALSLKVEKVLDMSWWHVFSPLFAADSLTVYFSFIVFIRTMYGNTTKKDAYKRGAWIFLSIMLMFCFQMLLCHTLQESTQTRLSLVLTPFFVGWVMLFIRMCKVN